MSITVKGIAMAMTVPQLYCRPTIIPSCSVRMRLFMCLRSDSSSTTSASEDEPQQQPPVNPFQFSGGALHNSRVVLVAPQHAGNVGSVCRAAANFECKDVVLVDPACDHFNQDGFNAASNPLSRELLQEARVEGSLSKALESCSMAVAFTRRTGKIRLPSLSLSDLVAPEHQNIKIALVFGRENCGLHTEEVLSCTHVCTIPTGAWQGSLNLSHAVAVVLSRLYESWAHKETDIQDMVRVGSLAHRTIPGTADIRDVENLLHRWEEVFLSCNYWAKAAGMAEFKTPEKLFLFLRKLIQRGRPSIREVAYLHGFLTVMENLAIVVSQSKKGHDKVSDS